MANLILQFIRFIGIGFLNTAVDFAVLNLFASWLGAYTGFSVALINGLSFAIAVSHSYIWNKYWAFGAERGSEGAARNLGQFTTAAVLGAGVIGLVLLGAGKSYDPLYFAGLLAALALGEYLMWRLFQLKLDETAKRSGRQFALFLAVSLVGIFINSGIVGGVTSALPPQFGFNQELWTNIIKAGATGIALVWNFVGYKFIVFKSKGSTSG